MVAIGLLDTHIFLAQNMPNCFCSQSSIPYPTREAYSAPSDLYSWTGPSGHFAAQRGKERITKGGDGSEVNKRERGLAPNGRARSALPENRLPQTLLAG